MDREIWFDIYSATNFIMKNGEPFEIEFLKTLIDKKFAAEFSEQISIYQNQDGGWTRLDADYKGKVSSITCTIMALSKFNSLEIHDEIYKRTLSYIKNTQHEEGFWDEVEDIVKSDPPEWFYPNKLENRVWYTNGLLRYLLSLGFQDEKVISKARKYLRKNWNNTSFTGYGHNNWMGIVTFNETELPADNIIKQECLKNLWQEAENMDLFNLLWTIESFISLNLKIETPIVERYLYFIKKKGQEKDGGFHTESGQDHRVHLANRMFFVCLKLGLISKDELTI